MGCSCYKRGIDDLEENYLKKFENSFGLTIKSSTKIHRTFHKVSSQDSLNNNQLNLACAQLNLPFSHYEDFFSYFLEGEKYSAKKLALLGILYGRDSLKTKLALLFDSYDNETSKILDCTKIREMVYDLLSVSCIYVPMFVKAINTRNSDLENLCFKLKASIEQMTTCYCEKILEENYIISKDSFLGLADGKEIIIANAAEIRKNCVELYNREIKPIENKLREFENDQISRDKQLYSFFSEAEARRFSNAETIEI